MSPHHFATSPSATGEERKFVNPTRGFVGANKFGPDGKPTSVSVEPGGEVWLTPEEERMTAEAPRLAQDNPFIREWEEDVEFDSYGEATRHVTRHGMLVLSEEPPRPVASDRFVPEREGESKETGDDLLGAANVAALREREEALAAREAEIAAREAKLEESDKPSEPDPEPETVKGADVPEPKQPAPQGQPSPDEIVGTPDAVGANDDALSERKSTAEQPTVGAIPT